MQQNTTTRYVSWNSTPLRFHNFIKFIGIPLAIISNCWSIYSIVSVLGLDSFFNPAIYPEMLPVAMVSFSCVVSVALLIAAIVGLHQEYWFGPCCLFTNYAVQFFANLICNTFGEPFFNADVALKGMGTCLIGLGILLVYYIKRRGLFLPPAAVAPAASATAAAPVAATLAAQATPSFYTQKKAADPQAETIVPPAPSATPAAKKFDTRMVLLLCAGALVLGLGIECTYLWSRAQIYSDQLDVLNAEVEVLVGENESYANSFSSLNGQIKYLKTMLDKTKATLREKEVAWSSDHARLRFWDAYAVVVTDTGTKYHRADCYHTDNSSYWIYNVETAISLGYRPCVDCDPPR